MIPLRCAGIVAHALDYDYAPQSMLIGSQRIWMNISQEGKDALDDLREVRGHAHVSPASGATQPVNGGSGAAHRACSRTRATHALSGRTAASSSWPASSVPPPGWPRGWPQALHRGAVPDHGVPGDAHGHGGGAFHGRQAQTAGQHLRASVRGAWSAHQLLSVEHAGCAFAPRGALVQDRQTRDWHPLQVDDYINSPKPFPSELLLVRWEGADKTPRRQFVLYTDHGYNRVSEICTVEEVSYVSSPCVLPFAS